MRLFPAFLVSMTCFSSAAAIAAPPADSIEYALPATQVKVDLTMVLEQCPQGERVPVGVKPTLTVTPVAVAGDKFRISGNDLKSWIKKRDLSLALYENGTIKTLGATTSDRTAAIAGSVIKLGTALVSLGVFGLDGGSFTCTSETAARVEEWMRLKGGIDALQDSLSQTQDPDRIAAIKDAIDALATRVADLREGPLKITTSKTIAVPEATAADGTAASFSVPVQWAPEAFKKWFGTGSSVAAPSFALQAKFTPVDMGAGDIPLADQPRPTCSGGRCPFVAVREPIPAIVEIAPLTADGGKSTWGGFETAKAKATIPVAQWGATTYYTLSAGLGSSRALKLELDPFGRKTSIGLNSEARGEGIASALAGVAEGAVALDAASSEKKAQADRIAELETEQKYNKLIKCEAIIEAGGYTCPE